MKSIMFRDGAGTDLVAEMDTVLGKTQCESCEKTIPFLAPHWAVYYESRSTYLAKYCCKACVADGEGIDNLLLVG